MTGGSTLIGSRISRAATLAADETAASSAATAVVILLGRIAESVNYQRHG
jgi:hypothetical protein